MYIITGEEPQVAKKDSPTKTTFAATSVQILAQFEPLIGIHYPILFSKRGHLQFAEEIVMAVLSDDDCKS